MVFYSMHNIERWPLRRSYGIVFSCFFSFGEASFFAALTAWKLQFFSISNNGKLNCIDECALSVSSCECGGRKPCYRVSVLVDLKYSMYSQTASNLIKLEKLRFSSHQWMFMGVHLSMLCDSTPCYSG